MGGNAIKHSRSIRQDEVAKTIRNFSDSIFPVLGAEGWEKDVMSIGSAGRKPSPGDLSGDIDVGIKCDAGECYQKLKDRFPDKEIKWMKGINVISIPWPIEGDKAKGFVQVDIMPLQDMEWAKFAYHHEKEGTQYKSAHRNWLLRSILHTLKEQEVRDDEGNLLEYTAYTMRLPSGLWKMRKTYRGKKKLLKRPMTIKESEQHITSDPQEFLNFIFKKNEDMQVHPQDVQSFEKLWDIVQSGNFNLAGMVEKYTEYIEKDKLNMPTEINEFVTQDHLRGAI